MSYIFFISLGSGLLAGVLAAICLLTIGTGSGYRSNGGNVGTAFAVSGITTFIFMFIAMLWLHPTFAHWTDSGFTIAIGLALIIGIVVGIWNSDTYEIHGAHVFWILFGVVFLFWHWYLVGHLKFATGSPNVCDDYNSRNAIAQLIPFQPDEALGDIGETSLEKISNERSLVLAQGASPQNQQLGEYLSIAPGFEQIVAEQMVNVHPYYPKDKTSYMRFNQKTPGHIEVATYNIVGYAQFFPRPADRPIKYVMNDITVFGVDLDWHIYSQYELPHGVQVWDLENPEVTDEHEFWYVGTIMKPSRFGARWYMPVGILRVDPFTGEYKEFTLEQARAEMPWLDNVMPREASDSLVSEYARYQPNSNVCSLSNAGQWKRDGTPVTVSRNGQLFHQYFITTQNDNDTLVQQVIYYNPQTMQAYRFQGKGLQVISVTQNLVEQKANPNVKAELRANLAKEPTHMFFSGYHFMVFVMENQNNFVGLTAIRSDLSPLANVNYVIDGQTLADLSQKAVYQLEAVPPGSATTQQVVQTTIDFQKTGWVEFISQPYMEGNEMRVVITLRVPNNPEFVNTPPAVATPAYDSTLYLIRINSRMLADNLVGIGHQVTVTGKATSEDPNVPVEASAIVNESFKATQNP